MWTKWNKPFIGDQLWFRVVWRLTQLIIKRKGAEKLNDQCSIQKTRSTCHEKSLFHWISLLHWRQSRVPLDVTLLTCVIQKRQVPVISSATRKLYFVRKIVFPWINLWIKCWDYMKRICLEWIREKQENLKMFFFLSPFLTTVFNREIKRRWICFIIAHRWKSS